PDPAAQARRRAVGLADGAVLTQAEQALPAQTDGLAQEAKHVALTVTHADPGRPRRGTPDGAQHLRPHRRLAVPRPALGARFVAMVHLLADPGLLIGQPEPGGGLLLVRRAHRQTTLEFEPPTPAVPDMPQAGRVRMGCVVHLRRILQEEHRLRA